MRRPRAGPITTALLLLTLLWALGSVGFFEGDRWDRATRNFSVFAGDFFPPDLSRETTTLYAKALVETVFMAYAGTLLGLILALPVAALAARTLSPRPVSYVFRFVLAFLRTIPSLLWALLFIVMVGLGPVPGVLALAAYTIGYLGKLYYERFEGVDPEVLEAVRATGAGRVALVRHVVLAESANEVLSQSLFIFEYNVRASSILGLVGAGGIGVPLLRCINVFDYACAATGVLFLLAAVLLLDAGSDFLRRRFLLPVHAGAPA